MEQQSDYLERMAQLLNKKEDLCPELQESIVDGPLGPMIKHPIYFAIGYDPSWNAIHNDAFRTKQEYAQQVRVKGEWNTFLMLHERPYRLEVFVKEVQGNLSDAEYWETLGWLWSDSENLWQYGTDFLRFILNSPRENRDHMMSVSEREFLVNLPDRFVIYRGCGEENREGFSWTLSPWKAKWFSKRFRETGGMVLRGTVKKKDVIAAIMDRGEFEIVVDPDNLYGIQPMENLRRPAEFRTILQIAREEFRLGERSFHGPDHWENVERNGWELSKSVPGCHLDVVRYFAMIHDARREDEADDPDHGLRAAEFAAELYEAKAFPLEFTRNKLDLLKEACRGHNSGAVSSDPTIGVCWDADRLDLVRVGEIPNPDLLSTEVAKKYMWQI